ncbi:alginate O-acetylation protein [Siccirubricoccus deserti]|uniref:Probable alginate O-acetylase AlgI n=1 Tax=Siccirubricoccus deserti TaxID=2013562 RepID=A0A9X0R095_9PROT|nr:MBOAT family protein [Siccirubricoccus deserti]MBC4017324.1 MBOAT family protein [Siccirubricoccus deserti]GGC58260.1 alginate O-acetylation protein [Siccirubricoccus deserti]
MLFNSHVFILAFLPVMLLGYTLLGHTVGRRPAQLFLVAGSLFFYGWWDASYLPLLIATTVFNYMVGRRLTDAYRRNTPSRRPLLAFGITVNLAILAYFKYATFFVENLEALTGLDFAMRAVVLPLGISFFIFQKIAYLADSASGKAPDYDFLGFCLFVSFFPQLIAGPIVHHRDVMGQFQRPIREVLTARNFALGVTFFTIGLFKKVMIADNLAPLAQASFVSFAAGEVLGAVSAWRGALAYAFQLYFDFSGYSDMAIGLGLMFGIRLPYNFNSPYKANSIIDFWRRWHMTLSRFLRDYVYVPLGGNRKGPTRRYLNLLLTMLLGGLWHGAAWTFVLWGGLHGFYLMVNHAWQKLRATLGWTAPAGPAGSLVARAVTFVAVVVGWVFFHAPSLGAALDMLQSMAGMNGLSTVKAAGTVQGVTELAGAAGGGAAAQDGRLASLWSFVAARSSDLVLVLLLLVAWFAPNSQEIVEAADRRRGWLAIRWQPTATWAVVVAGCLLATMTQMSKVSAFLYFQF